MLNRILKSEKLQALFVLVVYLIVTVTNFEISELQVWFANL